MKALKKLSCVLLAVLLVMSLSVTAFAAEPDPISITVSNAITGQTYKAYRLLDLESSVEGTAEGLYVINEKWAEFFAGPGSEYIVNAGIPGVGKAYVKWNGDTSASRVEAFAKAAQDWLAGHSGITADGEKKLDLSEGANPAKAAGNTVVFENMAPGYYLITSTAGSKLTIDATIGDVQAIDKNDVPSIQKEVQENSSGAWGKTNDADAQPGDVVHYRTTITVQAGALNYVLHDKMDSGLTFKEIESVQIKGGGDVSKDDYEMLSPSDGCTFEMKFVDEYIAGLTPGTEIVVSYSAVINESAVVAKPEINDSWLSFGQDSETTHDQTQTYTWELKIFKYIGTDEPAEEKEPLEGAKFVLSKKGKGADGNEVDLYATFDQATGRLTGWAEATVNADGTITYPEGSEMVTDKDGNVTPARNGLDAGTYSLIETEAPAGYNKAEPMPVVIEQGTGTVKDTVDNTVQVANFSGLELPETGGIGTTIFYTVGGILVAVALILLVTKKRMTKES